VIALFESKRASFLSFGVPKKKGDYLLFKQIISIMQLKEHLTPSGQKEGFTTKRL